MFRRVRLLLTTVVLVAVLLGGSVANAADTFRFHGSGYGHGIGMSQWGAYGLANQGWSYRHILTHFYSRTRVVRSSTLPKRVRVGLTSGRSTIHLKAKNGPVRLWLDGPGVTPVGKIPWEQTWTCFRGEHIHCGACAACVERRGAFVALGITDPTVYREAWNPR